jgi:hypothetical protein
VEHSRRSRQRKKLRELLSALVRVELRLLLPQVVLRQLDGGDGGVVLGTCSLLISFKQSRLSLQLLLPLLHADAGTQSFRVARGFGPQAGREQLELLGDVAPSLGVLGLNLSGVRHDGALGPNELVLLQPQLLLLGLQARLRSGEASLLLLRDRNAGLLECERGIQLLAPRLRGVDLGSKPCLRLLKACGLLCNSLHGEVVLSLKPSSKLIRRGACECRQGLWGSSWSSGLRKERECSSRRKRRECSGRRKRRKCSGRRKQGERSRGGLRHLDCRVA